MSEEEIATMIHDSWIRNKRSQRKPQLASILVILGLTAVSWSLIALLWSATHG